MKGHVGRLGILTLALAAFAAVHVGVPAAARGCECCACDFGGGDIECGDGDLDCGLCIELGGVPAPTCDACDGSCTDETLCAGDPDACSSDVLGGCCVDNQFGSGCFLMTGTACASILVDGMYRGDGSDCSAPCPAPNGSSCTTSSDCISTNCADGVCCDSACTGEFQRCNLPDQLGVCVGVAAPAPTLSLRGTVVAGMLLLGVAVFALGRRRHRG